MDKKLILSVAGSGKTTNIINSLEEGRRALILTYTNANLASIQQRLILKFGRIPEYVDVHSYFSFLYSFCYRPFFSYSIRDSGISWEQPPTYAKKSELGHYLSKGRYLYGCRLAKYIIENGGMPKVCERLAKYYDAIFVDEIQDFAANDFNFFIALSRGNYDLMFVGDFFQHTYDSSRDGNININLHKRGIDNYIQSFSDAGICVDTASLSKSYRCSPAVCEFVSTRIGVTIQSHRKDDTRVKIVESEAEAIDIYQDDGIVKLFLKEQHKYDCMGNNWGRSKGIDDYEDVCVVLNSTTQGLLNEGEIINVAPIIKSKLYVACTRARGNLYLVSDKHYEPRAIR